MGSTALLSGECLLWKNGTFVEKSISALSYDQDLGFFKVVTAGNIWMSFNPNQVVGLVVSTSGALMKKHHVAVTIKFPTGDEYMMNFLAPSQEAAAAARTWIDNLARIGQAKTQIQGLAKIKERFEMGEVSAILTRHSMADSTSDSLRMVESLITAGSIDGVIEGETFVSRQAKQRETVNYQVVTSFDIGKDGAVSLKCPSCGSPIQMRDASQNKKCDYCGADFVVPRRILDML